MSSLLRSEGQNKRMLQQCPVFWFFLGIEAGGANRFVEWFERIIRIVLKGTTMMIAV